jgi:hypothetical protein
MASCPDALPRDARVLDPLPLDAALVAFAEPRALAERPAPAARRLVVRPDRPAALDLPFDLDLAIALLLHLVIALRNSRGPAMIVLSAEFCAACRTAPMNEK